MHARQPDYGAQSQSTPQAHTRFPRCLTVLLNLAQTHRHSPHPSLPTAGKLTHCGPGFGVTHSVCSIDRRAPQSLESVRGYRETDGETGGRDRDRFRKETLYRLVCSPLCRVCLPPDSTPLGSMPVGVSPFSVSTFSLSSLYIAIDIHTISHKSLVSCMSEAFLE